MFQASDQDRSFLLLGELWGPHQQHEATRIDFFRETCLLGVRYPGQERPGICNVKGRECGRRVCFSVTSTALPWVLALAWESRQARMWESERV